MQKISIKLCSVLLGLATILFVMFLIANKFFLHNKNAIMVSLNPPETYQLGNYFELQKIYALVVKKNYGQDISDKSLNNDIFDKFWQRAISRDNRHNFWLENQYFKQRMTGDGVKDLVQLNDLIDKWYFSNKTHSIYLLLDNENQALNLIREYIVYTNNIVRSNIYSDIVARWKLNFDILQNLANSGDDMSAKYLNVIKGVSKLDDTLLAYSFATSPISTKYNSYKKHDSDLYIIIFLFIICVSSISIFTYNNFSKKPAEIDKDIT